MKINDNSSLKNTEICDGPQDSCPLVYITSVISSLWIRSSMIDFTPVITSPYRTNMTGLWFHITGLWVIPKGDSLRILTYWDWNLKWQAPFLKGEMWSNRDCPFNMKKEAVVLQGIYEEHHVASTGGQPLCADNSPDWQKATQTRNPDLSFTAATEQMLPPIWRSLETVILLIQSPDEDLASWYFHFSIMKPWANSSAKPCWTSGPWNLWDNKYWLFKIFFNPWSFVIQQ